MQKGYAIFAIGISCFISFILAVTVDMSHYELGALINYFWPPFVGILSGLLFLLLWWLFKSPKARIVITIILCLYNVYVGLALHLEKEYWPLVLS